MSTKRVSQIVPQVEVKFPKESRVSQVIPQVEVHLAPQRIVSTIVVCVEIKLKRSHGPAVQTT